MFKSSARYRPWEGYLLLVVIVIACILGIFQWLSKGDVQTEIPVLLTQETCKASGGIWNECGSACRGDQVDACMEVCVEYCECTKQGQCPFGFVCGKPINGIGICLK